MSQLQAAPAIGKAPPNPIFSADALKPLLQIGYQTPSSQLSFPERRLSAAGFAHSLSEPELTKKYNSKFLNLRSCSRPLTLSTFHAEHYWRPRVRTGVIPQRTAARRNFTASGARTTKVYEQRDTSD